MSSRIAAEPEALTRFNLASALPVIRMNCLVDAQVLAASCSELDLDPDKHALKERILSARSWTSTSASEISQLWADEHVKKTYNRLRASRLEEEEDGQPTQRPYVSSSSPFFLDRVLQYDSRKYIPSVQEYLQAERIARLVINVPAAAKSTTMVGSPRPPPYLQSYDARRRSVSTLPKGDDDSSSAVDRPDQPEPADTLLNSKKRLDFTRYALIYFLATHSFIHSLSGR